MIRDYKFQQTELPMRKNKRGAGKLLVRIFVALALAASGYSVYQWVNSKPKDGLPQTDRDSRIIPLQIPPNRTDSVQAPTNKNAVGIGQ